MVKLKIWSQVLSVLIFFITCIFSSEFSRKNSVLNLSMSELVETGAEGIEYCVPVEVLGINENENGYIEITTYENSFVKAPFALKLYHANKDGMRGVVIEKYGYTCYIMGFDIINIVNGGRVIAGDIVGSLKSNKLFVKVYKNESRISLKTIRKMFNV